jgi:hypothetical protein
MNGLLRDLRLGKLDAASAELLAGRPYGDLVFDLLQSFPVLFQERTVGRKREVGMARSLLFRLAAHRSPGSRSQSMEFCPVLWRCVFVSGYGDAVSEITQLASISVRPAETARTELTLRTGRGFKVDKTSDEWLVKELRPRKVNLSEEFLARRGWKFEALVPLRLRTTAK